MSRHAVLFLFLLISAFVHFVAAKGVVDNGGTAIQKKERNPEGVIRVKRPKRKQALTGVPLAAVGGAAGRAAEGEAAAGEAQYAAAAGEAQDAAAAGKALDAATGKMSNGEAGADVGQDDEVGIVEVIQIEIERKNPDQPLSPSPHSNLFADHVRLVEKAAHMYPDIEKMKEDLHSSYPHYSPVIAQIRTNDDVKSFLLSHKDVLADLDEAMRVAETESRRAAEEKRKYAKIMRDEQSWLKDEQEEEPIGNEGGEEPATESSVIRNRESVQQQQQLQEDDDEEVEQVRGLVEDAPRNGRLRPRSLLRGNCPAGTKKAQNHIVNVDGPSELTPRYLRGAVSRVELDEATGMCELV
eukprot:GHVU01123975.1.p1 GENE.GHVU01123975.1~~GHVU01123975.1.p1  ORF type:complete len:354 (+),score=72.61 GHVU01123975.1:197-1258(+)